jgi:FixJ family two-component response regulator
VDQTPASIAPEAAGLRRARVVILVEDDEGLRVALLRVLRACGFEASAYESAEAMLDDAQAEPADCLVVDVHLPGMSGLDLVDRLRGCGQKWPAVAISAHDEAGVHEAVRRRGIERFLGKPFLGSTLVRTVNELMPAG